MRIPETRTDTEFPDSAVKHWSRDGQLKRVTDAAGELLWGYQDVPGDVPTVSLPQGETGAEAPTMPGHEGHIVVRRKADGVIICKSCIAAASTRSRKARQVANPEPQRGPGTLSAEMREWLQTEIIITAEDIGKQQELLDALRGVLALLERA